MTESPTQAPDARHYLGPTRQSHPHAETPTAPVEVYVLEHHTRDSSDLVGIYWSLDAAIDRYGPASLAPASQWIKHQTCDHWFTTFKSGNYGSRLIIRKVTIEGTPPTGRDTHR